MAPEDEKARGRSATRGLASEREGAEPMSQPEVAPATASAPRAASGGPPTKVGVRPPQYMISPRPAAPGLQPLSADIVVQQLMNSPDITVVRTIAPPPLFGMQSADGSTLSPLVLARMPKAKADLLQAQAGARLTVERDPPLKFNLDPGPIERLPNPGILVPHAEGFAVTIEVVADKGPPLADADVFIFGSVWPTQGKTGPDGRATITIVGESPDTITSLYVKPKADYWAFWLDRPQLVPNTVNTITVKPLGSYLRDFPGRQLLGWGERAMGLDRIPSSFDGAGIKVAVVDSGLAKTHRNLLAVGPGASIVGPNREGWTDDTIGHGSHCAGVIAGGPLAINGSGIRGFAPAAQVHGVRIFPGGRFSDLVAALDYCMENGVDVVNLSLGGGEPSRIIEERLVRAKEMGIACIAAAGNSSGPVQYPASSTNCLAVAAIGKWGEFPEDSFHAQQALDGFRTRDGFFPAKFSCFGPEIDVAAPGVAIVSSLPADSFGAWDGTSMAAPHVTGLAALVLAHHPDFKGPFQTRDARRVERLFQILKESSVPLQFGSLERSGAGLPYAPRALGVETATSAAPGFAAAATPVPEASIEALRRLLALLGGGVAMQSAGVQPKSVDIGGPNAPVALGPARTGGELQALSNLFASRPANAGAPTFEEFCDAMRGAGMMR
jgi:subtilisin family serine protease